MRLTLFCVVVAILGGQINHQSGLHGTRYNNVVYATSFVSRRPIEITVLISIACTRTSFREPLVSNEDM